MTNKNPGAIRGFFLLKKGHLFRWRLGPDYWRKVIYDYHSGDQRTAESEYQEFLGIYEEEREKLETDTN